MIYADVMGAQRLQKILNLCCSYPIVLQEHLQGSKQTERLQRFIHQDDLLTMEQMSNKPNFIISKLAKEIRLIKETANFSSRVINHSNSLSIDIIGETNNDVLH